MDYIFVIGYEGKVCLELNIGIILIIGWGDDVDEEDEEEEL